MKLKFPKPKTNPQKLRKKVQRLLLESHRKLTIPKLQHLDTKKVEQPIDMAQKPLLVKDTDPLAWHFPKVDR